MARCGRCGTENPAGARACVGCGSSLARTMPPGSAVAPRPSAGTLACPACGLPSPVGYRFCGGCGAALVPAVLVPATPIRPAVAPPPPMAAPYRPARAQVTVLTAEGAVVSASQLAADETTVGTAGEVRLSDEFAAAVQGRFVFRGRLLFFAAERTLNGTFVLVKREVALSEGAEIRAGRQLLRLEPWPVPPAPVVPILGSPHPPYRYQIAQRLAGGVEGDRFPLHDGENLIGRTAGDLSFPGDGFVSSRHAMLTVNGRAVTLQDLGSSNGTFVRMDGETQLEPGDLLLVGEQLLKVDPP